MLPFILIGAATLLFGGVGVKKGYDGVSDMNTAKKIGKDAESRYSWAKYELERKRSEVNSDVQEFGNFKLKILTSTIKNFLGYLKQIKQKYNEKEFETIASIHISKDQLKQIEENSTTALKVVSGALQVIGGGATSIATGMALQGGAVFLVATFGSASTGTAISSLGGAVATNATLAWFGGGSIAAGGLGMAGGAAILGGIIIGPALAVGGFMLASKGEKALTKATEYAAEIDKAIAEINLVKSSLNGIQNRVSELRFLLLEFNKRTIVEVNKLIEIKDFDLNNEYCVTTFQKSAILIKSLSEILNTPVIDNNGKLTDISGKVSINMRKLLNSNQL